MTKVYSGLEVLEVMKDNWVRKVGDDKRKYTLAYKIIDGVVKRFDTSYPHQYYNPSFMIHSTMDINFFLTDTFSIWDEPLVAGDTVRVNITGGTIYGEIDTFLEEYGIRCFRFKGNSTPYKVSSAVRIEKDELASLKRKATFEQEGRRVDEFRMGDIVEYKGVKAIVRSIQGLYLVLTGEYSGHVSAKDVTPYKFATYVYATHPDYVKVAPCTAPPMPGTMAAPINYNVGGQF